MMNWLKHMLGIKTERQVLVEVAHEPSIKAARTQLKRVDRILKELEGLEGRRNERTRSH